MRAARRSTQQREAGFTLIETLIVITVIGILVLIAAPAFLQMLNRFKLTGAARELASLMQAARMEAIRLNAPAQVSYDATENAFTAFVDLDRDDALSAADRVLKSKVPLPVKVTFQGPGDTGPNEANAIDGWDDVPARPGPTFRPDGSVDRVGAFRLKDSNNNFLEVRIETPATGRMALRKRDRGNGIFYLNGEDGHKWEW